MTIFTGPVFDWRRSGLDWDAPPYESSSPNLLAIAKYMRETFGGGSMGIHFDKNTSNGVVSEHSWGAADDWGTGQAQVDWIKSVGKPAGKVLTREQHFAAIDWVVAHSAELHIQSIVDIGRSWRADRTDNGALGWKPYDSGYTGHAHLVTTFDGWGDDTPVADRLNPSTPDPGDPDMPTRYFTTPGSTTALWRTDDNLHAYRVEVDEWVAVGTPKGERLTLEQARKFIYGVELAHDLIGLAS